MNTQFKKGVLELCVLSLLKDSDRYGYELVSTISENIQISEGTIYPLLRRLQKDGNVTTYLQESSGGPPRKYYKLTENGTQIEKQLKDECLGFTEKVSTILNRSIQ